MHPPNGAKIDHSPQAPGLFRKLATMLFTATAGLMLMTALLYAGLIRQHDRARMRSLDAFQAVTARQEALEIVLNLEIETSTQAQQMRLTRIRDNDSLVEARYLANDKDYQAAIAGASCQPLSPPPACIVEREGTNELYYPLRFGKHARGWLLKTYSLEHAFGTNEVSMPWWAYLVAVVGLLGTLGLMLNYVWRSVSRPIDKLCEAIRPLGEGNLDIMIPEQRGRELEELAATIRDAVRRLKEHQVRLMRSERLTAIGQVAAQVAHEIKAPLFLASGLRRRLDEAGGRAEEVDRALNALEATAQRVEGFTRDILRYSGEIRLDLRPTSVHEIVGDAWRQALATCAGGSRGVPAVSFSYGPSHTHCVMGDSGKLVIVISNILSNALEALRGAGRIAIKTRDVAATDRGANPGQEFVEIELANDGPPIPTGQIDQIFEPFRSFGKQNGTGLGLAIARRIIDEHYGRIGAESTATQTIFRLLLAAAARPDPRAEAPFDEPTSSVPVGGPIRAAVAVASSPGSGSARRHVLLVNDDAEIRGTIRLDLAGLSDIEVHEAASVSDAWAVLERLHVDAILCDIRLESADGGYVLLEKTRPLRPHPKFLFVSGIPREKEWPRASGQGADGFIEIPYQLPEFLAIVESATRREVVNLRGESP